MTFTPFRPLPYPQNKRINETIEIYEKNQDEFKETSKKIQNKTYSGCYINEENGNDIPQKENKILNFYDLNTPSNKLNLQTENFHELLKTKSKCFSQILKYCKHQKNKKYKFL